MSAGRSVFSQPTASSIASGIPSTNRQMSTTLLAVFGQVEIAAYPPRPIQKQLHRAVIGNRLAVICLVQDRPGPRSAGPILPGG